MGAGRVALVLLAVIASPLSPAAADEIADSIAEVKSLTKEDARTEEAAVKIGELGKTDDPRVTKFLLGLTRSKDDSIAVAAYGAVALRDEKKVVRLLKSRAKDKDLAEERPAVYIALLDALVARVDKTCLDALETVVQRYLSTNAEFTTRAMRAYARVREKDVVDQLIKWLGQSESGSGTGTHEPLAPEARECRQKAHAEVLAGLAALTGRAHADFDAWRAWWKENERRFEFPEPQPEPESGPGPEPEEEPDDEGGDYDD